MEISIGNRKRIWIADEAIYIETKDAKIGKEPFSDYPRLKNASASKKKLHHFCFWSSLRRLGRRFEL